MEIGSHRATDVEMRRRSRAWYRRVGEMLKEIPKFPALALVVVIGLWAYARWQGYRGAQAITPIDGPAVILQPATQGVWEITWPEWPAMRSRPYVASFGRPYIGFDAHYDPPLFLRVHPRDAVEAGATRPLDADGWFEAGEDHDFDTVAWLEPGRTQRIEYRVGPSASPDTDKAWLEIRGIGDLMVWKDIVVNTGIVDLFALLFGLVFFLWLIIASRKRAYRRFPTHRAAGTTP